MDNKESFLINSEEILLFVRLLQWGNWKGRPWGLESDWKFARVKTSHIIHSIHWLSTNLHKSTEILVNAWAEIKYGSIPSKFRKLPKIKKCLQEDITYVYYARKIFERKRLKIPDFQRSPRLLTRLR